MTAGSGADTINLAKAISSEVYTNQGNDLITASGDATTTTLAGGKGSDSIVVGQTSLVAKFLVTPVQTASPSTGLSIPLLFMAVLITTP